MRRPERKRDSQSDVRSLLSILLHCLAEGQNLNGVLCRSLKFTDQEHFNCPSTMTQNVWPDVVNGHIRFPTRPHELIDERLSRALRFRWNHGSRKGLFVALLEPACQRLPLWVGYHIR